MEKSFIHVNMISHIRSSFPHICNSKISTPDNFTYIFQTITRLDGRRFRMAEPHEVKITVLKRFSPADVFDRSPVTPVKPLKACELFEDGQEFIVDLHLKKPEGFCSSAWHTIYCSIRTLAFGGNMPWYKEKGVAINCCIDGLRPVIFKLERI